MKVTNKAVLALILVLSITFFSGLGFSQEKLSAAGVFRFFASFYLPYEAESSFSMTFGRELLPHQTGKIAAEKDEMPQRNFLK